jgi:hypothetical protein
MFVVALVAVYQSVQEPCLLYFFTVSLSNIIYKAQTLDT